MRAVDNRATGVPTESWDGRWNGQPPSLLRHVPDTISTTVELERTPGSVTAVRPRKAVSIVDVAGLVALTVIVGAIGATLAGTGRGAFFDEAVYLIAGKALVFRGENWHFETWFVGSPFAFPRLAGLIQWLGGGLVAVRTMNVGFLLVAVCAVKLIGDALGLRGLASLLGAAAFGLAGPVLFTGSFATYDMPALAATMLAFWLALRGTDQERPHVRALVAAGVMFGGAVIIKYIVIALAPVFAGIVFARLAPVDRSVVQPRRWAALLVAVLAVAAPAALVLGGYLKHFWWQLQLVFAYSGGHTTNYGATASAILVTILLYAGPAWLLALFGLESLRGNRRAVVVGLVLFGGSLVMPLYHMWRLDPLALFKQISWSLALTAPLVGLALARLAQRPRLLAGVALAVAALTLYQVMTLRAFYPDPRPAAAWLQAHVDAQGDPILVDDVWPYRLALADIFDGREWWVADQWWWQNQKATPELWRDLIQQGRFGYVVFERRGAFNGEGSVFDKSVIEMVERSGQYHRAASFPSRVTWGNAILPPPFRGQLPSYTVVQTEIWVRAW